MLDIGNTTFDDIATIPTTDLVASTTPMISLRRVHLLLPSKQTLSKLHFSTPSSSIPQTSSLTDSDLSKLNLLIPRLCHSNHLPTALRLTTTALLTNPPLHSLPLSPLIYSLTSQPDMTHTMSLLTHLLHTPPSHPYIAPISLMLLSSYFQTRNCKHALKLFRWLKRPGCPCSPDEEVYRFVVEGLCRNGVVFEGLVALREMIDVEGVKLEAFCDSGKWVYKGLLKEARVKEAMELNHALLGLARAEDGNEERDRVLVVLERIIAEWNE